MAEKRMINRTIVDSDTFLDMPVSAQNLYFHLNLRADDEGFIDGPKKIARTIGAAVDDLKILLAKRYLLSFESGVVVVKHWKLHNAIRTDRIKPTLYIEERESITEKANGAYTDHLESLADISPQNAAECPRRLEEIRLEEIRLEEKSIEKKAKTKRFSPPTLEESHHYCQELGIDVSAWHDHFTANGWKLSNGNPVKDWKATARTWKRNDEKYGLSKKPEPVESKRNQHGTCKHCGKTDTSTVNGSCADCRTVGKI